jgi:riboflavin kinase/FMN adenylyltransferase
MKVIQGVNNFPALSKNTIIALGNFDGVHIGHQKILNFLVEKAEEKEMLSLVLTFSPHPEKVLGRRTLQMIQTLEQRLCEIEKFRIQMALVLSFDKQLADLSSHNFVKSILVDKLKVKEIIVGHNFRFGKDRKGSFSTLSSLASKYHYSAHSIHSVSRGDQTVSSSLIRTLLLEGKMKKAKTLLGRAYEIEGTVVKGKSRGKNIGFPTANMVTDNEITPLGVYLTSVDIGYETYKALTNIGSCPTFLQNETQIESHIVNFHGDLYGKKIRVRFIEKIRDEIKFKTPQDLALQIRKDLEKINSDTGSLKTD